MLFGDRNREHVTRRRLGPTGIPSNKYSYAFDYLCTASPSSNRPFVSGRTKFIPVKIVVGTTTSQPPESDQSRAPGLITFIGIDRGVGWHISVLPLPEQSRGASPA
jgi:hypothetical protein